MIKTQGGKFLVDVKSGDKRRRVICGSLQEAESLQAQLIAELQATTQAHAGWTIGATAEKVKATCWLGKSGGSDASYNADLAVKFFGGQTPLDEITTDWIDGYVAHLQKIGNAPGTINRKLAALSKLFTYAFQRGKVKSKPHVPRQQESEGRIRFLTRGEEEQGLAYLSQWGKDDHAEAICVLIDTGMRPSELWRLQGRDCDFARRIISVWQTKNGKPRSVPMTRRVHEILSRRHALGVMFPFNNNWLRHAWDRMKHAMNLSQDEQFIPYALRHTCASRLVQRGVHLRVVQEWMGHKTLQITMRYAHLSPTSLVEAVKVLEAV